MINKYIVAKFIIYCFLYYDLRDDLNLNIKQIDVIILYNMWPCGVHIVSYVVVRVGFFNDYGSIIWNLKKMSLFLTKIFNLSHFQIF